MPAHSPSSASRSTPLFRALLAARWLMLCCLPALFAACALPLERIEFIRPSPPPPALAAECMAGPDYPAGDLPLGEVLEIVASREHAAAECRAKHRGLSSWAERVTRGDLDGGRLDH